VEVAVPQDGLDTKINFTVKVSVLLNFAAYGPATVPVPSASCRRISTQRPKRKNHEKTVRAHLCSGVAGVLRAPGRVRRRQLRFETGEHPGTHAERIAGLRALGILTPSVGMVLYITTHIAELPISKAVREILPFYVPLVVSLIIIIFFPSIPMVLPDLLMEQ
jgi:hypothetical protein